MSLIAKAREFFRPGGLACPRCEKPLEGHDDKACARRMSRRYFFGALAAGVAAAALPRIDRHFVKPDFIGPHTGSIESGVAIAHAYKENGHVFYAFTEHIRIPLVQLHYDELVRLNQQVMGEIPLAFSEDPLARSVEIWPQPMPGRKQFPIEKIRDIHGNLIGCVALVKIENAPSRARRCPAYNEHTGAWDKHKDPRRLPA